MAARATRSASLAVHLGTLSLSHDALLLLLPEGHAEAVTTCHKRSHLLALSHDALGVIVDGLADPLQPVVAVALSSTCLGLRTPLQAALEVLKERHERAVALSPKLYKSCAQVRGAEKLYGNGRLVADDMATLAMILQTNGLPRLWDLFLAHNGFGDAGMQALCGGLGRGVAPSLLVLGLRDNKFGPAGAEALAAALRRGAMPKLARLNLHCNPLGNQGVAALAAPLRKLPALDRLLLGCCEIGDEGVTSLVGNLGKDDFKALELLYLEGNKITDAGVAKLLAALEAGGLPKLVNQTNMLNQSINMLKDNPASAVAVAAVHEALVKRGAPVGRCQIW